MTSFAGIIDGGDVNENIQWTLTISGEGDIPPHFRWEFAESFVKKIIIENGVISIGQYAFNYFSNLNSVQLPNTLQTIEQDAFSYCSSLIEIEIPASVINFAPRAVADCNKLETITVNWQEPPSLTDYWFGKMNLESCSLIVPAGTKELYEKAYVWKEFQIIEKTNTAIHGTICQGDSYPFDNQNLTVSGVYSTFDAYGTVTLYLTVNPSFQTTINKIIYVGDSFSSNGFSLPPQPQPCFITDSLFISTTFGCDSVVILNLIVIPKAETTPSENSAVISWQPIEGATGYKLIIYSDIERTNIIRIFYFDADGNIIPDEDSDEFRSGAVEGFSYQIDDLTAGTIYYYTLTAFHDDEVIAEQEGSFETADDSTVLNDIKENSTIKIYTVNETIFIENAQRENIAVYDVQGQLIASARGVNGAFKAVVPQAGVYLVRVGVEVRKVIIN